ncbi:MAG: hypothetical protein M3R48_04705 [Candidatus Dormibacteraeota bacterium]|nr:hypothetical protein [Candidatus Dormibacteraeota bacterium]
MSRGGSLVPIGAALAIVMTAVNLTHSYAGIGRSPDGCTGAGGGGTSAIYAQLACGLPPPAAPTTQNTGSGSSPSGSTPQIGSACVPALVAPAPPIPDVGSRDRQYIDLSPSLSGDPATGLTAGASIVSPLPIGSPSGPMTLAVPPRAVTTAAQQNAEAQSEAAAIAAVYNQQQVDVISAAQGYQSSAYLQTLLRTTAYTAANFYLPPAPPVTGATATSEDATTWALSERVYLHPGFVTHTQTGIGALGAPAFGAPFCSGLAVTGTDQLTLRSQVATAVSTFTAQVNRVADSIWASFRRGAIVSEPTAGHPAFVGAPTCVGLNTGLPTGSATPNPFSITLPLSLSGVAGQLPVTVFGRVSVSIAAGGVHWDFHDPSGDTVVIGQDGTDPTAPVGAPVYDAASGTWPNAGSVCAAYHQYRGLSASGVMISASEHFTITVSGAYSTGSAVPTPFTYQYEPPDSPVTWTAGPFPIYQIEAVPFAPSP